MYTKFVSQRHLSLSILSSGLRWRDSELVTK